MRLGLAGRHLSTLCVYRGGRKGDASGASLSSSRSPGFVSERDPPPIKKRVFQLSKQSPHCMHCIRPSSNQLMATMECDEAYRPARPR